jgi:drug efflux transport system permease protein
MRRILIVAWKELKQIRRDSRMFATALFAPVLQLAIFGYAATFDLHEVPVAVLDLDQTPASRAYVSSFDRTDRFAVGYRVTSYADISDLLARGKARLAIVIPAGFGRKLRGIETTAVQIIVDGSDPNSANVGLNDATVISERYGAELMLARLYRSIPEARGLLGYDAGGATQGRVRVWFNPELKSRTYMVPGVVALTLFDLTMLMTALSLVREKESGSLEHLTVTPLRSAELVIGKLLPPVGISFVDVTVVLLVATLWFQVPIKGSLLLLYVLVGLFLFTTLSLGLLISTISETQREAQLTSYLAIFPIILLSGFIFPIANMPMVFQYVTYLSPFRYFLIIIRGIFLKGSDLTILWPQALALVLLGSGIFTLSLARLRRQFP